MTDRVLVDGVVAAGIPADDRGLAYGDGLFETILLHAGRPVWWDAHLDRLERGAAALGIRAPARAAWQADIEQLQSLREPDSPGRAVLKLTLTRGSSGRGYASEPLAPPRRLAQLLPAPPQDPDRRECGITLRWCVLRLSEQSLLAGFKHLNRLEQVLARAEWDDPSIADGLLCRADGKVVSATSANLFLVRDGVLLTPMLDRCGVAGICRGYLLSNAGAIVAGAGEAELSAEAVLQADELFLCNSVRGILPVSRLGERILPVGPITRALIRQLAAAEPAFA